MTATEFWRDVGDTGDSCSFLWLLKFWIKDSIVQRTSLIQQHLPCISMVSFNCFILFKPGQGLVAGFRAVSSAHVFWRDYWWSIWFCWRRKPQSTPVFVPGKSQGQRRLGGYSSRDRKESDTLSNETTEFGFAEKSCDSHILTAMWQF